MENISTYKKIKSLAKKSPAKIAGLKAKDTIISINNEPILDFIDDNYFNTLTLLNIKYIRNNKENEITITKSADEPLGIHYEENLYPPDNHCINKCIFCFVDQLPSNLRDSLYIKDDDWIYSILFGNYITLTNVTNSELNRIIKRKASPLYISIHAIDANIRQQMMGSKKAGKIKEQLKSLADNRIIMHTQIVLCPQINDGKILNETIEFLASLYPYVRSLAIVPVGLTKHRDGLPGIRLISQIEANHIIDTIKKYNKKYIDMHNANFVYASDEMYSIAKLPYPTYTNGEHMPQLSNGVGMFSELINEYTDALSTYKHEIANINSNTKITLITGVSAYEQIASMLGTIKERAKHIFINLVPIKNQLFGDSITVAGLLSGADIARVLKNIESDVIIVPASTLKDGAEVFLDDMTINELEEQLSAKIVIQEVDGYAMVETIIHS